MAESGIYPVDFFDGQVVRPAHGGIDGVLAYRQAGTGTIKMRFLSREATASIKTKAKSFDPALVL
jgi:hypothetical protein